jgi:predicted metalloprotease with PDZ domain
MAEPVRYRVTILAPHRHEVEVEATFPTIRGRRFELHLPVWTPGSYLVRDFARHVSDVRARDASGRALVAAKVAKSTWRVEGARGALRVSYRVYANERSVRTSHVTSEHAFLSPPTLFLFEASQRARACEVALALPRGWRVATALAERRRRFHARDYDELVDSPIECGHHRPLRFDVAGTPFRAVICGPGNHEVAKLKRDLARVAAAERELFGSFPFASYLAIVNLSPAGRGGLEHRASTALEWPGFRFRGGEKYQDFLALFAHELFHAWNVKTAAPARFRPYDYLRETPTPLLWWFEGVTDYYAELLLRRGELLTPRAWLDRFAGRIEKVAASPGRLRTSVAGASFDAWIKFYRPDENSANSTISYYEKGHLVGALLDLEVRRRSGGRRSLDDVIRRVVRDAARGLGEDGIARILAAVTGSDFAPWLARYVHGTAELPFGPLLRSVGLVLKPRDDSPKGGWLGIQAKSAGGRLSLASVVRDGPAEAGGLAAFDEVVALDRNRVDEESLRERLEEKKPGDRVRFTVFRDDRLHQIEVRLGTPPVRRRIVAVARPTAAERSALESWLRARHDELEEKPAAAERGA